MRRGSFALTLMLFGALTISGCFFVSKSEVKKRVRSALPNVEITSDIFRVDEDCSFTTWIVHDELTADQILQSSALFSFRQLGKTWREYRSYSGFVTAENREGRPEISHELSGAVLSAKRCFHLDDITLESLATEPIIATTTLHGLSVLFFFKKDMSKFYYFISR
ncbi:hypothetical protein [Nitratireductor sp. XY-223]|uniref:hypothetical protein n=1 Tax=Nitratireductor sp. XY-223 TaxID=2561926 RepID=UPI0010AA605B|nr:hypothetical protein [Nitratireductor sp. XY-223]